ncbi:MAG TPA: hypothetical protein VIN60_01885 [Anaerolineales bacterium]
MKNSSIYDLFKYVAIAGNVLFILWVTYNGIDEGFSGTRVQIASYVGLMLLLSLNTVLILRKERII